MKCNMAKQTTVIYKKNRECQICTCKYEAHARTVTNTPSKTGENRIDDKDRKKYIYKGAKRLK